MCNPSQGRLRSCLYFLSLIGMLLDRHLNLLVDRLRKLTCLKPKHPDFGVGVVFFVED